MQITKTTPKKIHFGEGKSLGKDLVFDMCRAVKTYYVNRPRELAISDRVKDYLIRENAVQKSEFVGLQRLLLRLR